MDNLSILLATITGLISTTVIGGAKLIEQKLDIAIVNKLGNLIPVLAMALNFVLPKLGNLLHWTTIPDGTVVASAPVGFAISLIAREIYVLIFKKEPQAPASV